MKTILILAGTLALACSTASIAQPAADVPSVVVHYADLNLDGSAGLEQLYKRVSTAAHVVCRALDPSDSADKLALGERYQQCLHEATMRAVGSIARPAFTAWVADKMPRRNVGIIVAAR